MATGRRKHDWQIASHLMATIAEPHRDARRHPAQFKPSDFNPMSQAEHRAVMRGGDQLIRFFGLQGSEHAKQS